LELLNMERLQLLHKMIYKRTSDLWNDVSTYKLNRQQAKLLIHMHREGGKLKLSELAESICITAGGLTLMSDRLVEKGLVIRARDESDRRIVYLELSEDGERAVAECIEITRKLTNQLIRGLGEQELEQLEKIYTVIHRNAENMTIE